MKGTEQKRFKKNRKGKLTVEKGGSAQGGGVGKAHCRDDPKETIRKRAKAFKGDGSNGTWKEQGIGGSA